MGKIILFLLSLILEIILIGILLYVNIFPQVVVLIVSLVFLLIFIHLLLRANKGKKVCLRLLIISLLIGFVDFNALEILYRLYSMNKDSNTIEVALRVNDLDDKVKTVGIMNSDNQYLDEYLKDKDYKVYKYNDHDDLAKALYDEKIDGVVCLENYAVLYDDEKFTSKTKVKDSEVFTYKVNGSAKKIDILEQSFNIYISGNDNYGDILANTRSDVNMIVSVNPKTRNVLMTSIPRDYYVNLANNGKKDKLTHASLYGIENSVETLEDLLDIDINYYAKVDFTSLVNIVDALGGITIYSDITFTSYPDKIKFNEGYVHADGNMALAFARERHAYEAGDEMRVINQQAVLRSIIEKASEPASLFKFDDILKIVSKNTMSNVDAQTMNEFVRLGVNFLLKDYHINSNALSGIGAKRNVYSMGDKKVYVMIPDEDSVDNAKKMIKENNLIINE